MQKKSFHIYLFKELGLSAKGVNDSTISLLAIALKQQIALFILEALGLSVKETKILQDWSCCCTLTFGILHFEAYDILKSINFLIGFLDELGNFKQKKFTFQNVILFLHFTAMDPIFCMPKAMLIPAELREASKEPTEARLSLNDVRFNSNWSFFL